MNGFSANVKRLLESYALDLDPEFNPKDFNYDDYETGETGAIKQFQSSQISTGSYKAVKRALIESYQTKKSLLIYGDAGIGKSTIVKSVCKKIFAPHEKREYVEWRGKDESGKGLNREKRLDIINNPQKYYVLIDVRGAELEPVDLRGIEMPNNHDPYLNPKIPMWVYLMAQPSSSGTLFLDEINQSAMQVLNAMYGVVLDKQAGETQFAPDWTVVAAGNLGSEFINSIELPQALTRRFGVMMLVADPEGWLEWAEEEGIDPLIIAYVKSRPDQNFYAKSDNPNDPMPDPRNLEAFSDSLKKTKHMYYTMRKRGIRPDVPIGQAFIESAARICGITWAQGFYQFYSTFSKLDWDTMHGTREQYAHMEVQNIYANLVFIFQKMNNMLNSETELSQKFRQAAANAKAGTTTPEDRKFIDETWKIARQFLRIVTNFLHNRSEYTTTLINMLNAHDKYIMICVLAAAKMHPNDEVTKASAQFFRDAVKISEVASS